MSGTLYLVATPIGNLEDMTFRAIRTLKEADLIAAEDTRNSIKLLNHFEIKTPMTSYHEFNKVEKAHELIEVLRSGKNVALITDAGMPGISDPGEELVKFAGEAGIKVTIVPGACAAVSALVISGQPTGRFAFEAFLPSDAKDAKKAIEGLKDETRTLIIYEAPHRLKKTLARLYEGLGNRELSIVKELTKTHENVMITNLEAATSYYETNEPRGEYVLVIKGRSEAELKAEAVSRWEEISVQEHMDMYIAQGMDRKEAMKAVAADRGVGKREIYDIVMKKDAD